MPVGLDIPFVAWLAVVLWSWLAFSESLLCGSQAICKHGDLISKVAVPHHLLVFSIISSVFILHAVGYAVVLIAIEGLAVDLVWLVLPYALGDLVALYLLAIGLGLVLAAVDDPQDSSVGRARR